MDCVSWALDDPVAPRHLVIQARRIARRERLNSLDVETAQDFRRAGLQLARHFALLPLGPDPESGRWQFADLRTGEARSSEEAALIEALESGHLGGAYLDDGQLFISSGYGQFGQIPGNAFMVFDIDPERARGMKEW